MKKIDKIINSIRSLREETATGIANTGNMPGMGGAMGSNSPNPNMPGFDPLMTFRRRKTNLGFDLRSVPAKYRKWIVG